MLGYVLVRQPTVILRRKSECLDMCTSNIMPFFTVTTVNVCNVCKFDADLLFSIYCVDIKGLVMLM